MRSRERVVDVDEWISIQEAKRVGNSFKIEASRKANFRGRILATDLSPFNGLSLVAANHSESPLLVGIKLIHGPDGNLPPVSLSGGREELKQGEGRELEFPREAFGTYGFPMGWSQIQQVEVTFSVECHCPAPRSIQVSLGPLEALVREIPTGPRLSQEGLRNLLASDVSGVTSFFAREGGDAEKVSAKYGHNWSWKPYVADNPGLLVPPPHPYPKGAAEQILAGQIMGQQIGCPVDWDADPLGELEWRHFLHRHHFLRELVKAFVNTGDAQYIRVLDSIILTWIHANPVPLGSNGGAGPSWETLSVAWRLREWLWVAGIAWPHESFGQGTKMDMLCSIWEHARSLMDHRGHANNWIIVESAALALAGLCFPQFKEAGLWVKTAIERLRDEFRRQFFADGVHFEISPLYHAICAHALLEVKQVAEEKGMELSEEFHTPLERCFEYLAGLCRPDFTWPSLNDSGGVTGDYTALMLLAGEVFNRPDFAWLGSTGASGAPPAQASHFFSDAGIAAMRSNHSENAHFLVFRAGPPGASHIHDDSLSLDVTAFGCPRVVDPGITSYAPGPMTEYYRSASAHSIILIDGKGPDPSRMAFHEKISPAGEDFHWKCQHDLELATGVCEGPRFSESGHGRDCVHVRTVAFVRREYWIVRDIVAGEGSHEITTCWQFFPGPVDVDPRTHAAVCLDARGLGFELIPPLEAEAPNVEIATGSLEPPRGWVSMNGCDVPATAFRYSVRATLPVTMIWLLLPFSRGQRSAATVKRRDTAKGDIVVEVALKSGTKDILIFPYQASLGPEITAKGMQQGIGLGVGIDSV